AFSYAISLESFFKYQSYFSLTLEIF
ncbi:uncharacterized protein METZ01_LOCUS221415, partial [marine metagenome]